MADTIDKPAPLVIQEQGSFALGGTVMTTPGTFDPANMFPEGQTIHGDHAFVFNLRSGFAEFLRLVFGA